MFCGVHLLIVYGPVPTGALFGSVTGLDIFEKTCSGTIGVWSAM